MLTPDRHDYIKTVKIDITIEHNLPSCVQLTSHILVGNSTSLSPSKDFDPRRDKKVDRDPLPQSAVKIGYPYVPKKS